MRINMEEDTRYFEGCGYEGPIRCIFLCEFHPVVGPKITCQVLYVLFCYMVYVLRIKFSTKPIIM